MAVVNEEASESKYAEAPAQPGRQSRACSVNSFAGLPAVGDVISDAASRHPALSGEDRCWHSGLWWVVADCAASLTAPGAQIVVARDMEVSPGTKESVRPVVRNAAVSQELFKMRSGGWSGVSDTTDKLSPG